MKTKVQLISILVCGLCAVLAPCRNLNAVSITDYPSELPLLEQEPAEDNAYLKKAASQLEDAEIFRSKDYFHINLTSTFHVWAQKNTHATVPLWECLYTELNYYKEQSNVVRSIIQ